MKLSKVFGQIAFSGLALGVLFIAGGHAHAAQVQVAPVHSQMVQPSKVTRPQLRGGAVKQAQFHQPVRSAQYQATSANSDNQFARVSKVAHSKLGAPYVYGATGPHAFDCSGFTRYVYKHGAHVALPRTAEAQREATQPIARGLERPGDLAFFGYGTASHVGMVLDHGKMIDAQNRGVIVEKIHAPWWHLIGYGRP